MLTPPRPWQFIEINVKYSIGKDTGMELAAWLSLGPLCLVANNSTFLS
jgi:hypothetical protein